MTAHLVHRLAAAAAVIALLAVAQTRSPSAVIGAVSPRTPVQVSATSRFLGCLPTELQEPASHYLYPNAEVEPRIAVDPRSVGTDHLTMVGVWQQDRWSTGGARGLMAAASHDGGTTWTLSSQPFSSCAPGPIRAQAASDPWVSIGPDGTVYTAGLTISLTINGPDQGVAAAVSQDGGMTWIRPRLVARDTPELQSDKEAITADPLHPGVAYLVWDRFGDPETEWSQPLWFSRTIDFGQSWSEPRQIAIVKGQTVSHQIVVDSRSGTLYDIYSKEATSGPEYCQPERQDCSNQPVHAEVDLIRSTDMGDSWTGPTRVATYTAVGAKGVRAQIRSGVRVPDIAVDPRSGTLYVVWEDSRFTRGARDTIAISSSNDGGRHWTAPRQVRSPAGRPALTPALAVNSRGVVGVTYYTLYWRKASQPFLATDYWFTSSADTRTFTAPRHVMGPYNMLNAPNARGFFVGDYEGLVAGTRFEALFAMPRTGAPANRTDIFWTELAP